MPAEFAASQTASCKKDIATIGNNKNGVGKSIFFMAQYTVLICSQAVHVRYYP